MASIRIRYWAAARAAAGVAEEDVEADDCAAALEQVLAARHGDSDALQRAVGASSFLVDGVRRDRAALSDISGPVVLEVLPPFAGG